MFLYDIHYHKEGEKEWTGIILLRVGFSSRSSGQGNETSCSE
jgi:hypothetical protein